MRRLLEMFLQMNEPAGGLDQAFEEIGVARISLEPKLLKDIVRFVIMLLVPALKIGAVIWVSGDLGGFGHGWIADQLGNKPRNPLAFVHGAPNLTTAQTMGKRRSSRLAENERAHTGARGKQ